MRVCREALGNPQARCHEQRLRERARAWACPRKARIRRSAGDLPAPLARLTQGPNGRSACKALFGLGQAHAEATNAPGGSRARPERHRDPAHSLLRIAARCSGKRGALDRREPSFGLRRDAPVSGRQAPARAHRIARSRGPASADLLRVSPQARQRSRRSASSLCKAAARGLGRPALSSMANAAPPRAPSASTDHHDRSTITP